MLGCSESAQGCTGCGYGLAAVLTATRVDWNLAQAFRALLCGGIGRGRRFAHARDQGVDGRHHKKQTAAATNRNETAALMKSPIGNKARLVAVNNGKDTTLDLRSVTINGRSYLITVAGKSSSSGLGANKRTAKYVGGGAAIGAVLGALLGGVRGAAIGALVGGAGGAGAQVYRGRKKEIPAETELSFKLAEDLQLRPMKSRASARR